MAQLPDDVRTLLEGPNVAHLATVLPDGSPHTVPVWIGLEDGRIAFFTGEHTRKARNLAAEPRVALSLVAHDNPYRMASVRGRVTDVVRGETAMEIVDRIAHRYTGEPFPMRDMTIYLIEPERSTSMNLPFEHTPPG
jgi:PPOX class probable F420-dependent enzyme